MAASVQSIENAIITKLQETLPELSIEAFPENPTEYELIHPLGSVLVQYDGSTFRPNKVTNGAAVQIRDLRFVLALVLRNLRDSGGCYDVLQRAAEALGGLVIPGAVTCLTPVNESFSSEADGVWVYVQGYEVSVKFVSEYHR